jgi:hypothetical protein
MPAPSLRQALCRLNPDVWCSHCWACSNESVIWTFLLWSTWESYFRV